ncbi:MAG: 8-amino-7-oxononanoate synthase [Nitrospinae bacterium]|nr:8-amino-7-oxononanoate synthase [Nitrospinota bacterium]
MSFHFQEFLSKEINLLREEGLLRELKTIHGAQGPWVDLGGRRTLLLCSNDYLGLASDHQVTGAFTSGVEEFGTGSGASRLISGNRSPHEGLEKAIAQFKGTESALLFNSGYHANIGAIPALFGEGDLILSDELNHASLIDGCRLSKARVLKYPHKDCASLKKMLRENSGCKKKLVLTDGVFSMDGDIAPLPGIVELAGQFEAVVMVDDAHATGVLGPGGKGTLGHFGLEPDCVDIQMGTLGKALGCFGAFVAGKKELTQFLTNKARSFIYTTALPPALAAAACKALEIAGRDQCRRDRLWENVRFFKEGLEKLGFDIMGSETPIVPIFIGDPVKTMKISACLLEKGLFVQGIRPPSVPEGKSRLRAALSASHTMEDLEFALEVIENVGIN